MPDGAPHCDFSELEKRAKIDPMRIKILASIHSFDEFGQLCLLLKGIGRSRILCDLEFAYIPMRQDRDQDGVVSTCKLYADMLKDCLTDRIRVTFFCPHSNDAVNTFTRNSIYCMEVTFYNQEISKFLNIRNYDYIVFPDAGAKKRFGSLDLFKFSSTLCFEKTRDPHTGRITISNPLKYIFDRHHNILVFDDICDGGATFIEIAKLIRANTVDPLYNCPLKPDLFVYHGIFSKGYKELAEYYSKIYTTNSFWTKADFCMEVEKKSNIVKVLNLYDWN